MEGLERGEVPLLPTLPLPYIDGLFSKGIKRGEYGVPTKIYFCGVRSPFKKFSSLSPYEGERDKG